jgi:hypothetical protein
MENPPLGRELVAGALVAFKAAHLVTGRDEMVRFAGATVGGSYGPADLAQCVHDPQHAAPREGCTCGFYAFRERDDAIGFLNEVRIALLEVELWGAFHEYEHGYVAAAQNVRTVTLFPYCVLCRMRRQPETRAAVVLANRVPRDRTRLIPVCDEHAEAAARTVTLFELRAQLGVEARWAEEDDPLTEAVGWFGRGQRPLLPRNVRLLDDLVPGETAHVFQNAIAQDNAGGLFIDPLARLIQPLPGTDVPIRLADDGHHEVLLDGLTDFEGWRPHDDTIRFALPVRAVGRPPVVLQSEEDAA